MWELVGSKNTIGQMASVLKKLQKVTLTLTLTLLTYLLNYSHTHSLTHSLEQNPSWESNWFSAGQKIPYTLHYTKVHCYIHKCNVLWMVNNMIHFHGEMLPPRPTPKLEDHPLSSVCDCLFSIFAVTLHIGDRSSICNLRMHHAMVARTHLSWKINSSSSTFSFSTHCDYSMQLILCGIPRYSVK